MPTLIESINGNPNTKAFLCVNNRNGDDPRNWQFEPMRGDVLADSGRDEFYVIAAMNVLADRKVRLCYMDISLPERINDYTYFIEGNELWSDYTHKIEGDVIPAIAMDCFGVYELFYSKIVPELGIEVLRRGLAVSKRKHFIAEDLGYIFRDEKRYREAAEMFQVAADEEVSSCFIYGELAEAYRQIGDTEKQKKYAKLWKHARPSWA